MGEVLVRREAVALHGEGGLGGAVSRGPGQRPRVVQGVGLGGPLPGLEEEEEEEEEEEVNALCNTGYQYTTRYYYYYYYYYYYTTNYVHKTHNFLICTTQYYIYRVLYMILY